MIKIKFFSSVVEAQLSGNLLKKYGIENWVQKRGLNFPGDLGDSYGADLFVKKKDVEKAREILGVNEK